MFYFEEIKLPNGKNTNVLKSDIIKATHFFTTRDFLLKAADLVELNDEANANLNLLCEYLNITKENLHIPKQTHSDNIQIVNEYDNEYAETDGLISNKKNSVMLLNFADCTPIILYDEKNNVGSVVHAGWRGTAKKIVQNAVDIMQKKFKSEPKDITAAIGPAIGACCYCVDSDVCNKLSATVKVDTKCISQRVIESTSEKYNVDLKKINAIQLEECGVKNIDTTDYCTSCSNDLFFSYRKENGKTARHSAILKL